MGHRAIKRRITSLRQQIDEHESKIANEMKLVHPDHELIIHWQVEIEAFNASLQRAMKRLG